ncbi:hypothetical protein [Rhodoferax sp.]|uniref:hypothetical protein n=1 Tax=Rhodoferax sp. TaxID=50421 RepID=UPI002ACE9991|nr:hypothetical protein [Rhodoferax sp.]MDZ7918874.1 hypothetical protein [Rhodoferax sp.]
MNQLPKIVIALAALFASLCSEAGSPADLTGVHQEQTKCDRSNGVNGPAYMASCYEGYVHQHGMRYSLVQNGENICGSFDACGGFNCNKIYSGEVVGRVRGDKVTLYVADGHREYGEANVEVFKISARGELLAADSGERVFTKTSAGVISPKEKSRCQPKFNEPVLLKDYELGIQGTRPHLDKFEPPQKPAHKPPKQYTTTLKSTTGTVRLQDAPRAQGNLIPRMVWIHNTTSKHWNLSAESTSGADEDEACQKWLEDSEKKSDSYVWAYDKNYPTASIPPKSTRYTRICAGDTLNLEKGLPECPKFQCLRTCRC